MKDKYITCRDIQNKKYKIPREDLNFRPAVYGLVFKKDKVLLARQWDGYDFPGGGIKRGELIEDALKREVFEETGIKVKPSKILKVCEDFFLSNGAYKILTP